MTHGQATPHLPQPTDPKAARISDLSEEYLDATPERREAIGAEIAGMIDGKVLVAKGGA